MDVAGLNRRLKKRYGGAVTARREGDIIRMTGALPSWEEVLAACGMAAGRGRHVVNDIACTGEELPPMRLPSLRDGALEGRSPDVLIIGGGISGAAIARELTRWRLDVLLAEKEPDLAMQASGRNDGEVHPGVDLGGGTLKHKYVLRGNAAMERVCGELGVPFAWRGQYVGFRAGWLLPLVWLFSLQRRLIGVRDTRVVGRGALRAAQPALSPDFAFALYNSRAGSVCPFALTVAYAENAAHNGAEISLDTAALSMELENGRITAVRTNRGTVYPKLVINAAGTFADCVAEMAGDRFYSIHPRRGTNTILDKQTGAYMTAIAANKALRRSPGHSKGGGVVNTAHGNLLVGPDAVETPLREDFSTERESIERVFDKQRLTMPTLSERDIITYFTGVRACTFEEDFVIERGRKTRNLIHCAGIQSPGLTAAPAFAADVAAMAAELLGAEKNPGFDPIRKPIPELNRLPDAERDALIKQNPDYGVIVCRCEEISLGEIEEALASPVCPPTLDAIKRRLRPGMGRCQGGVLLAAGDADNRKAAGDTAARDKKERLRVGYFAGRDQGGGAVTSYDVIVIGGGPAGLAAAISARKSGAAVALIEREERLGGILKQCIHDGFGLVRFGEKLSGPEYAQRFIGEFRALGIPYYTQTFVTRISREGGSFALSAVRRSGVERFRAAALVFATGCRERTARQVSIHGARPSGIFTAGTAQYLVNILGQMPTRRCVILGSGDIGLIMARRLTLEGAEVLGVYEIMEKPAGLPRNLYQCLEDFGIPLHLSHTVTRVFGTERLTGVEVAAVDAARRPLPGTGRRIDCDALILSVGLIPENELPRSAGVEVDARTGCPRCDQRQMSNVPGIFCCGNSLHVFDLVDYVSDSGEAAGAAAAAYAAGRMEEAK